MLIADVTMRRIKLYFVTGTNAAATRSTFSLFFIIKSFFPFFPPIRGRVKTWFPVSPLPKLSLPSRSPPTTPPLLLYLCRGLAVTEHSEVWRRIRRLSPKNNKRSWKKRQEFLGCDVRLFTPESSRCSASSLHLRRVPTLFQPHRWLLFARKKMKSYLRNSLRYRDFCDTTLKSISDRGRKRQRRALSAQGGGASVRYWFHPSPDPRDLLL